MYRITDYYHDNVFAACKSIIPAREKAGAGETCAVPHPVWIGQGPGDQLPVLRNQVRMARGDVLLSLFSQVNVGAYIWAWKQRHSSSNSPGYKCQAVLLVVNDVGDAQITYSIPRAK